MKARASIVFALSLCVGACAALALTSRDFQFVVAGTVRDSRGQAISGVAVRLKLKDIAYKGTEAVKDDQVQTDEAGSFAFGYIVRERHNEFELTFQKAGYAERVVSGSAPPAARFMVTMIAN